MTPWLDISIFGLTIFIMLVGLFGLLVPVFPGIVVIWLAALGYGVVSGFSTLGIVMFVLITIGMLVGVIIDEVMMGVGARQGGASWWGTALGLVAGVVGTFAFPPIGGLIAAPLVVLLVEYARTRDWKQAFTALRGLTIGWGLSFFARFGIGVLMIGSWLIWAFAS